MAGESGLAEQLLNSAQVLGLQRSYMESQVQAASLTSWVTVMTQNKAFKELIIKLLESCPL